MLRFFDQLNGFGIVELGLVLRIHGKPSKFFAYNVLILLREPSLVTKVFFFLVNEEKALCYHWIFRQQPFILEVIIVVFGGIEASAHDM